MHSLETSKALGRGPGVDPDDLPQAIERRIEQAVCGQISGLTVARLGDAIVLHGHSRTYHATRLAQHAALDLLEESVPLIDMIVIR
jgi:hypothetical protein